MSIFIGIIIGAFAFIIITALIIDAFIEIPQDRAVLYAFGSNNRAYMIVAMISMMLWIAFMLRNEIRKFKIGRLNFRIALFAAGVIATTLMIVYSCRNYVKIDDDSMISIEKGIEGSLNDVDELEDNVKDMDKEAKASFERIKEMFS